MIAHPIGATAGPSSERIGEAPVTPRQRTRTTRRV
jgi:hypothetical protein